MIQDNSFVAFFSYVQRNDEHDKGRLTFFRKLLEAELWAQTGKDLQIFQDKEDIEWGDNWKEKITKVLNSSMFLIAVITPSYLESKSCTFEFECFLKRESALRQKDLILPILYIDTDELKKPKNHFASEISKRQWVDFRDLRFASLDSVKVNKKIEGLAKRLRQMLAKQQITHVDITDHLSFPSDWKTTWQPSFADQTKISPKNIQYEHEIKSRITVLLKSTGDIDHDRRRIKTIYGTLISFRGNDYFSFQIIQNGQSHLIDFPNDTTLVGLELLSRLKKLIGEESWLVEEIKD